MADRLSVPPPLKEPPATETHGHRDLLTNLLLAANVLVFGWQMQLPAAAQARFERLYVLRPFHVFPQAPWQLLTYQFIHGGWIHLLTNLLVLHSIGPVIEEELGIARCLGLYLFSGAFGGAVQLVGAHLSPELFNRPVVGASAGICGLLAALCAIFAEDPVEVRLFYLIPLKMRAKFLLLAAALVSLAGAIFPFGNVAHLAHLGGLVGGLVGLNLFGRRLAGRAGG